MSVPFTTHHYLTRPLDALAAATVVILCLSWGFNQVATKLAIHDIPPLVQAAIRSTGAALIVVAWCWARGVPLPARDGTLPAGLAVGLCFSAEFTLIYQGLACTTAARAALFLYLAPFFVVLGARLPPCGPLQRAAMVGTCAFASMLLAFGVPMPVLDPRQAVGDVMLVFAAMFWASTTLLTKTTRLVHISAEKVMLYQLVVSAPVLTLEALVSGQRLTHVPRRSRPARSPIRPSGSSASPLCYGTRW